MPDQPGSAPSKRPSAKETLTHAQRELEKLRGVLIYNDPLTQKAIDRQVVIVTALRLLERAEYERPGTLARWASNWKSAGHAPLASFLSDLAALVAPTDAEEKGHE